MQAESVQAVSAVRINSLVIHGYDAVRKAWRKSGFRPVFSLPFENEGTDKVMECRYGKKRQTIDTYIH